MKIPIKPQSKARHRFNTKANRAYTPEKTRRYEEELRLMYQILGGKKHFGAVTVKVRFCFATKDRRKVGAPKTTKPDLDNLLKALLDSLRGVAIEDDNSVVFVEARKEWALEDFIEVDFNEARE